MTALMTPSSPVRAGRIGAGSGRLNWTLDGDDLVARGYRVRLLEPFRWEASYRGRLLGYHTHRSVAVAIAQHHHRETQRIHRIEWWAALAGAALLGAVGAAIWLPFTVGFFVQVLAIWLFLSSTARCIAATSRSLLDPYRAREPGEPSDWWNR